MCKTMARLVCRISQLKVDDYRYNDGSITDKMCHECDIGIAESIYHLVMQCPANEESKKCMFRDILKIDSTFDERSHEKPGEMFYWLLGKPINGMDLEKIANIWIIAGHCITEMYNQRLRVREGVG